MKQIKLLNKKILGIISLLIITALVVTVFILYSKEDDYQKDADIVRLQHLNYYINLIDEYKEAMGSYPLQEEQYKNLPVYVLIANSWQEEEANEYNDTIPYSHFNVDDAEFFQKLEIGLGDTVGEYYDPQKESTGRPNYYVYFLDTDGNYYMSVHTNGSYPFAFQLADDYHKVQATSNSGINNGQAVYSGNLLSDQNYLNEISKQLSNEQFFIDLENEYLQESKLK